VFEYKFSHGRIRAIKNPSKLDRKVAIQSYSTLTTVLEKIHLEQTEIKIEESKIKTRIPLSALKVLAEVLEAMGEGKMISIVPIAAEVTTQAAGNSGLHKTLSRKAARRRENSVCKSWRA
jgi:hypothetical protein